MTIEEAKNILINRGFVEINGDLVFDGNKWRNAITVISKWLEQEPIGDCISREAVLDKINQIGIKAFETYNDYSELYDFVDSLPSVTPKEKTGWIPVSERLPEDYQRVLVTVVRYYGDKIVRVAEYYSRNNGKGMFRIKENDEQWEVGEKGLLAWMPLPEPYEPQESEDKK